MCWSLLITAINTCNWFRFVHSLDLHRSLGFYSLHLACRLNHNPIMLPGGSAHSGLPLMIMACVHFSQWDCQLGPLLKYLHFHLTESFRLASMHLLQHLQLDMSRVQCSIHVEPATGRHWECFVLNYATVHFVCAFVRSNLQPPQSTPDSSSTSEDDIVRAVVTDNLLLVNEVCSQGN